MKKFVSVFSALLISLLMFGFAGIASAHEHDVYQIGDKQYQFVVGSLNEPVVVDDKTGVDLTVTTAGTPTMSPDGDMDGPPKDAQPQTGLEKTLQVEISAGSQKKTFSLVPDNGKAGGYYATFYPTVQTTYAYRFFGTLNNTPIDLTFTCSPDASAMMAEDKTVTKITDQVSRLDKAGAFGCPLAKADYSFPQTTMTNADLSAKVDSLSNMPMSSGASKGLALSALILSLVGIAIGGYSLIKK